MKRFTKRKPRIRVYRNADAEIFVQRAKFAKRQREELEEMNRSFDKDEWETEFDYAIEKECQTPTT